MLKKILRQICGISRRSFCSFINQGLEQLQFIFEDLYKQALEYHPGEHAELGELVSIDGSLINVFNTGRNYRKGSKKPKYIADLTLITESSNKIFLTEGTGAERTFVPKIFRKGQTGYGSWISIP
ncbi:MAG: hypothetical protein HUK40_13715 [Desulfobacter sp.]|nr:hypothetical protein [Desulfobacter sp.]